MGGASAETAGNKILLVDDEDINLRTGKRVLNRQLPNSTVLTASSYADAADIINAIRGEIVAVVSDLKLNDEAKNGLHVLQEAAKMGISVRILYSGEVHQDIVQEAASGIATAMVAKPDFKDVVTLLKKCLFVAPVSQ